MYCICRKPDSGKWMIGCDGCDDWFHGECVKIEESDGDLVDKYFCMKLLPLSISETPQLTSATYRSFMYLARQGHHLLET